MQTLYLIRHTTPDIPPGICYGQLDVGLSKTFGQEAHDVLEWLPPVELVIASPLLRTRKLGEFLSAELRCPLHSDARLMEKHFGTWEGKAWDAIPRAELDAWASDIMGHAPPDGESARQLEQRVRYFLDDVTNLPQRSIAVVAHGGSIRAVLALLAGTPLSGLLNAQISCGAVITVRS